MSFYPNEELLHLLGRISGTVAKALATCNDSSSGFQQEEIMFTLVKALFFCKGSCIFLNRQPSGKNTRASLFRTAHQNGMYTL